MPVQEAPPEGITEEDLQQQAREHEGSPNGDAPTGEPLEGEGDEGAEDAPAIPQLELEGLGSQLTVKSTGAKPDKATVKLQGGSIGIPVGQYERGEVVDLLVRVRCTAVGFIDKLDNQTGRVVETERRHQFKVTHVERVGG